MSRSCDDSLVQLYVDGGLEPTERLVVGEHIRTCPVCRKRLMAYKSLFWDLAHPGPDSEPAPQEALALLGDQLTAAWEQAVADRTPIRSPARTAWDLSTVGLRSSPVGDASATVLEWVAPVARQAVPTLGRTMVWAGRVGRFLADKGVKRR